MPNQRVAVITGGAMGIGAECAEQLAHHGLHVVITDRDTEAAAQTSDSLIKAGLSACAV
jgi:3-oxoacyl-[acyl-carrier protein] reductase